MVVLLSLVDEGFLALVVDVGVGAEVKLWRHAAGGGEDGGEGEGRRKDDLPLKARKHRHADTVGMLGNNKQVPRSAGKCYIMHTERWRDARQ
jgi:hypothetical protein